MDGVILKQRSEGFSTLVTEDFVKTDLLQSIIAKVAEDFVKTNSLQSVIAKWYSEFQCPEEKCSHFVECRHNHQNSHNPTFYPLFMPEIEKSDNRMFVKIFCNSH